MHAIGFVYIATPRIVAHVDMSANASIGKGKENNRRKRGPGSPAEGDSKDLK